MRMETVFLFAMLLGYIVGLGAVTVIDLHGFLARRSSYWTLATIRTHKITKPLIWIGITLVILGWYGLSRIGWFAGPGGWMPMLYALLVANGAFLSFVVSPMLLRHERDGRSEELLSPPWQAVISASFVLSVIGWWGTLLLFVQELAFHSGLLP